MGGKGPCNSGGGGSNSDGSGTGGGQGSGGDDGGQEGNRWKAFTSGLLDPRWLVPLSAGACAYGYLVLLPGLTQAVAAEAEVVQAPIEEVTALPVDAPRTLR